MAIFRGGKRVGPFDIRIGLPRGREYDNIPGDPRLKQRANPETTINRFRSAIAKSEGVARSSRFLVNIGLPKGKVLEELLQATSSNARENVILQAVDPIDDEQGFDTGQYMDADRQMSPDASLLCTEITMPGRTINTSPYRIAGAPYKYPTQVQYSDITATFIGDKFLRHIERCKNLVHLIDITENNILENYLKIRKELSKYSNDLLKKKEIIIFNKIDIINTNEIEEKISYFKKKVKKNIYKISIAQNKGLLTVKKMLINNVHR